MHPGNGEPSKLQRKLAVQIAEYIRDNGMAAGAHLTEAALAEALGVSRTPVRRALDYLTDLKMLAANGPRRGFEVIAEPQSLLDLASEGAGPDEEEALYLKVANDYVDRRLPDQFSEADLMRQYGVHRGLLLRILQRMAREGVVERSLGHGWRFLASLRSVDAHDKSYRFRVAVESAAILEPTFVLDRAWAERTRRTHEALLAMPAEKVSMITFFEANQDFHEGLAACSGNEFFHQSVQLQTQIRRFLLYSTVPVHRIEASCNEHLEILTAIESGDRDWAARLMQRHLEIAARDEPRGLL